MTRVVFFRAVLLACHAVAVACGGAGEPANLRELQRVQSAGLDIVVLTPGEALRTGKDTFFIEFRSAGEGRLVDVGTVQAVATMPMAGMAPMSGSIEVTPTSTTGRYSVNSQLSMAGDWRIGIEWNGPAGRGSASVSTFAQ